MMSGTARLVSPDKPTCDTSIRCGSHVSPPLVVESQVDSSPQAQPCRLSIKETEKIALLVLLCCGVQVLPPSRLCTIVPLCPTAQPVSPTKVTWLRLHSAGRGV